MTDPRAMRLVGRVAFLGLLLAAGCFFEPREPEPGGGPVCYEKIPQEFEQNVFANLDGSFRCRQSQTYLEQFAEDFEYVPPPSVLAANPGASGWGIEKEGQFVDQLFVATVDTILAQVYDEVRPPQGSTEVLFEGEYSITIVSADGTEEEYFGTALYTLRQERAIWLISRWEEQESDSPLGLLKTGLVP